MNDTARSDATDRRAADVVFVDAASRALDGRHDGLLSEDELQRAAKQLELGLRLREREIELEARRLRTEHALKMERLRDEHDLRMQLWIERQDRQERHDLHDVRLAGAWVTVLQRAGWTVVGLVAVIVAIAAGPDPTDVLRTLGFS